MKKLFIVICFSALVMLIPYSVKAIDYRDYGFTQEEAETNLENGLDDCLYTDFKDTYYTHGEYISVQFEIRNSKDLKGDYEYIVSVEPEGNDFDKSIKIITNTSFEINFYSTKFGEFEVKISAKDNQGSRFQTSLYVFSTEDLDFVSKTSFTQTKRQYFMYLFDKKMVNEEDYNSIVYGYEKHTDITEFMEETPRIKDFEQYITKSSSIIYIYGYIRFEDVAHQIHPAKNIKVTLYDEDLFGIRQNLGAQYTSNTGLYWFSVENDTGFLENGYDIILEIKLGNESYQVQDFFQVYEIEYGPFVDVTNTYTYIGHTFEYYDSNNDIDDFGVAANLYEAATIGFDYLDLVDSEDLEDYTLLGIEYPYGEDFSWYDPLTADIYMGNDYINDYMWDTLLHEFGHYVAHQNDITSFWPAVHSMEENQIYEFGVFGKTIGRQLVWSEGWAHYFCVMVQQVMNSILLNVPNVGDTLEGGYDMETVKAPSYLMGEGNEYVMGLLLYDIADTNDDVADDIDWGHDVLFDYLESYVESMKVSDPDYVLFYFNEFYDSLNLDAYDDEFGPLMTYYKISAALTSPTSVSYNPPSFNWDAQGGITYNINNDFTLYIMDSFGNLLLDPIPIGNNTTYVLDEAQWTTVLSSGTSNIKWNVSAIQTTGTDTGPYFAERITCNLPVPLTLAVGLSRSGNILFAGSYIWYKFTASSNSSYTFVSTGTTDTYAEFFNTPVAGTSIIGRLYYNNDSGPGLNFSKTITLLSGQTIYLRVRGNDWTETGAYLVEVSGGGISFEY
ncbi:MAG: hypothetical protein JEZ05_04865 [Tenericutes bacterium]|nr:hypothetical protein [Mycoplasmatota bacterium]